MKKSRQTRRLPWGVLVEASCKLGVNSVAIAAALAALAAIAPHYQAQQERLQAIQREVARTERRVEQRRQRLQRNLDPLQAEAVMQEQTARVHPQLWPIVFLPPAPNSSGSHDRAMPPAGH